MSMTFTKERHASKSGEVCSGDGDILLWRDFRQGSKEAFEALYHRHADHLYNYGVHTFMDKALVEDAIQDLFLDLWRRKEFLGETDSVRFYLFKSLKRNIARKIKIYEKLDEKLLSGFMDEQHSDSAEAAVITNESFRRRSEILDRAIRFLPERQRAIIVYRFYQDLTPAEIASLMSLSIDSTYTLLSRAVHTLRKSLGENPRLDVTFYFILFGPLLG